MYDDWAYHVSPSLYAPQPTPQKIRRRRKSILQDVALEHVQSPDARDSRPGSLRHVAEEVVQSRRAAPQIPEYTVPARRSNSMSGIARLREMDSSRQVGIESSLKPLSLMYPFTPVERNNLIYGSDDELSLMDVYDSLEKEIQDAEDAQFLKFHATAESHRESCKVFVAQANSMLELLDTLAAGFDAVRKQTSTFQDACDELSVEHSRLESLADDIERHLKPFNMLEEITKRLNMPGTDFVTQEGFKQMLSTLDQCIDYCDAHPNFNGIDLYVMRFRQCMTRALTLIRVHFINAIRDVASDVQTRIAAKALNETTQSALFYTKFKVDAPVLQGLTDEIRKRCEGHDEYSGLLADCYKYYTNTRRKLIIPVISKRVMDMKGSIAELLQLTRQGIAYMRTVCMDEYELFYALFTEGEGVAYEFLESLCEPLQDVLRSRIIHEKRAEVLYELCSLLQGLSTQDGEEADDGYFDRPQLDFGKLFQSTLQDAQMKLVFRMQAYA
ncbi:Sec34-like family-domain-containing protein [Myxozyma melibiosi]|uniref:Conserved oligomeric Golgi complex subunit 3 n=1 Tax=Myxozyma melibiosi TaxID=54550 RepID=A0ABR1FBH6_9ASCO